VNRWHIIIEAWPHSTGNGQTADQAAAGERVQSYYVDAEDIAAALKMATCIVNGMLSNPMVWHAPITSIVKLRDATP
jgi:hypothetical protein